MDPETEVEVLVMAYHSYVQVRRGISGGIYLKVNDWWHKS